MAIRRSGGSCAWLALAGAAAIASAAFAERMPYSRYQSIVDRQMFGPLPAGFDPSKSPSEVSKSGGQAAEKELTKEQEKIKSAIRFSVINVTPDGETAIGFTDNSDPKAPKHYYLKVGESRGGWEVKEADAKAATMTVAKDGIEVSLSLGGDSSKDGKTQAAQQPASRRSAVLNTLGSRRRARIEREEADQRETERREAEAKAKEEERARREEEEKAQREAEREELRRRLDQIMEEQRKAREERKSQEDKSESSGSAEESSADSE